MFYLFILNQTKKTLTRVKIKKNRTFEICKHSELTDAFRTLHSLKHIVTSQTKADLPNRRSPRECLRPLWRHTNAFCDVTQEAGRVVATMERREAKNFNWQNNLCIKKLLIFIKHVWNVWSFSLLCCDVLSRSAYYG